MSGYDPMEEFQASLESIDAEPRRRITVPPPPTDDFTVEIERPAVEEDAAAAEVDDAAVEQPRSIDVEKATIALPTRGRGRGLAVRKPNGPMKSITASLPAHLVDRVTGLRLDAEVAGRSFKLTELFSSALLDLPSKPAAVAALIDRYSSQFNYDRTPRDEGFIEERRFSTQITPDAAQHVATVVRAVYQEYGSKLANKDLYAVALLSFLADRT